MCVGDICLAQIAHCPHARHIFYVACFPLLVGPAEKGLLNQTEFALQSSENATEIAMLAALRLELNAWENAERNSYWFEQRKTVEIKS